MRKKILIFLTVVLLANCTGKTRLPGGALPIPALPSPVVQGLDTFALEGCVKEWQRQVFRLEYKNGEEQKILLSREWRLFNLQGDLVEARTFSGQDGLVSSAHFRYDTAGVLLGERVFNGDGKLLHRLDYTYHSGGGLNEEIRQDELAGWMYIKQWDYNSRGWPAGWREWMQNEDHRVLLTRVGWQYTGQGLLKKEERQEFRSSGEPHFRVVTAYTPGGNISTQQEFDSRNKLTRVQINRYDAEGHLIRSREKHREPETGRMRQEKSVYTYNRDGHLLLSLEAGVRTQYIYSSHGLVEEVLTFSPVDTLRQRKVISYPDGGRIETQFFFTDTGELEGTYRYLYNGEARLRQWEKYDALGLCLGVYPVLYTNSGKKREEVVEEAPAGLPFLYRYRYDEAGNHVRTTCFSLDDAENPLPVMLYEYSFVYYPG